MARALQLARRGLYTTDPNPRVGCVLVDASGVVVGEGWHAFAGEPHAEVHAIRAAGAEAAGATAYVTLEPCAHHGRTPPCADALIAAGVARVVAAMEDPNPRVAGGGLERLREAGIEVETGLGETQARELNIGFIHRFATGRPWVRVKIGASLDGRTALAGGESQWITGEAARRDVQHWRARSSAVVTGAGTLRDDDPSLTVRLPGTSRQPLRVAVLGRGPVPETARMYAGGPVLVVCPEGRAVSLPSAAGMVECVTLAAGGRGVDPAALLTELAARGCNEVLIEAGATLSGAFLERDLVDEMVTYLAPTVLGADSRGMFAIAPLASLAERSVWDIVDTRRVGADLRIVTRARRR